MSRIVVIVVTFVTIGQLAQSAEAQWVRTGRPAERIGRFLGIGWGAGYHWRTPGPDSSYYFPFSPLNTPAMRDPRQDPIDDFVPGPFRESGWPTRQRENRYTLGDPPGPLSRFQPLGTYPKWEGH